MKIHEYNEMMAYLLRPRTNMIKGKKSGPPPISGPTPDGDEGLPAAFKNVRKR